MGKIDELTNEASAMQKPVSDIAERGGSGAIAQLIQQYCPDGVGYVQLGEVCEVLTGGEAPDNAIKGKEPIGDCKYPIYSNGIGENALWGYAPTYRISKTSITFSSIGTIGFPTIRECCYTPIIRLKVIYPKDDTVLNVYFLKYVLEIVEFEKQKSSVPNINANMIKSISIPLPPLPVQEAIVNILDRFAVYAAELQAELQARQQQYNYYRDTLLSFEGREDVQWVKLGEVCIFVKDGTHGSYKNVDNGYPLLSAKDINNGVINIPADCRKISCEDFEEIYKKYKLLHGDVLITIVGSIGRTAIVQDNTDVAFQRSVGILRPSKSVLSSYLFYTLQTTMVQKQLASKTSKSAQGGVYLGELCKIIIPIPPLSEQQRIVNILDRFDTLVNDLSQGLPAEIEARQQQYEYYRDQLLTFKRKEA